MHKLIKSFWQWEEWFGKGWATSKSNSESERPVEKSTELQIREEIICTRIEMERNRWIQKIHQEEN